MSSTPMSQDHQPWSGSTRPSTNYTRHTTARENLSVPSRPMQSLYEWHEPTHQRRHIRQTNVQEPPVQLAPLRPPQPRGTTDHRSSHNRLSISNLLSAEPNPPSNNYQQQEHYFQRQIPLDREAERSRPPTTAVEDQVDQLGSRQAATTYHPPLPLNHLGRRQIHRHEAEVVPHTARYGATRESTQSIRSSPSTAGSAALNDTRSSSSASPQTLARWMRTPQAFPTVVQPPPLSYSLVIRQQPIAARACGFGERDRRVIDPPPILELKIVNKATGVPELDHGAMLALRVELIDGDPNEIADHQVTTTTEITTDKCLMGNTVTSPYQAKDERGIAGAFFVFSDLSCRMPGRFRLHFTLMRVDPTQLLPGMRQPCVASIGSDPFTVYTAKDFPGMRASTRLLTALREQGLNVGLKKGTEARMRKRRKRRESSTSDDDLARETYEERRVSRGSR